MKAQVIMIDADDTLYHIQNKEAIYEKMLRYVAQALGEEYLHTKEKFFNILEMKSSSLIPKDRRREVPLKEMGLEERDIKNALKIFKNEVCKNIIPAPSIKVFLETCMIKNYKVVIFSDEFREFLFHKLRCCFGKDFKKFFYEYITPELTQCMKPCIKYYTYFPRENIKIVIGDDYKRDLKIAKEELGLKVALYAHNKKNSKLDILSPREKTEKKVDMVFSDYTTILKIL